MLSFACVVLYGMGVYHISIAMNLDLGRRLERLRLGIINRIWGAGLHGRVAMVLLAVLVLLSAQVAAFGVGEAPSYVTNPEGEGQWVEMSDTITLDGYASEGSAPVNATPDLGGVVPTSVNVSLQWVDNDVREPPAGPLDAAPRNRPDTLRLSVKGPGGTTGTKEAANDPSTRLGELELGPFKAQQGKGLEGILVTVECLEAGDVTGRFLTYVADGGNDYVLFFEYTWREWVPAQDGTV